MLTLVLGGLLLGQAVAPCAAAAQSPFSSSEGERLSLEEATSRALRQNLDVRLARADTGFAQAGLVGSRLRPSPSLAAEGLSNGDFRLSLTQELQLWGLRGNRIRAAALEQERIRYTALDIDRLARREVTTAYREVLFLNERVALLDSLARLNQRIARAATLAVEQGLGSELDSRLSFASWQQSMLDRDVTARLLVIQQIQLARLLGDSLSTVYRLTDSLPVSDLRFLTSLPPDSGVLIPTRFTPDQTAVDTLVQLALSQRPDVRAAETDVEAQQASLTAARSAGKPSLAVGAIYARNLDDVAGGAQQKTITDNGFGLGLVLGLPIWNRNQGEISRAQFAGAAAVLRLAGVRQALERDVRVAVQRAAAAASQVETLRSTILPSNQAALRLGEAAFERGQLNILQVLQVRGAYVESITALLEATREFAAALAELEAAVGSPVQ